MGRAKKYKNAAEKQKAWRQRHGQKVKVPLSIRRGEKLGTSEGQVRERKEGESWEEYSKYLELRLSRAKIATARDPHRPLTKEEGESLGAKRAHGKYKEPFMDEGCYERQRDHEISLEKATKPTRGKLKEKRKKTKR